MDIAKINHKELDLPILGKVEANFYSVSALRAVGRQTWDDPYQFVRMLLTEFVDWADGDEAKVKPLTEPQLDEIAVKIWDACDHIEIEGHDATPVEVADARTLLEAYRLQYDEFEANARKFIEQQTKQIEGTLGGFSGLLRSIQSESVFTQLAQPTAFESLTRSLALYEPPQIVPPHINYVEQLGRTLAQSSPLHLMIKQHDEATRGINAILESFRSTELAMESIKRSMGVGVLSAMTLAAAGQAAQSPIDSLLQQGLALPGFAYAAQAAVAGFASQAATAEVLALYHDATPGLSAGFRETLAGVHALDIDEPEVLSEEQVDDLVEELMERMETIERQSTSWMHPQTLLALAMMLMTAAQLYFASGSTTAAQIETLQLTHDRILQAQISDLERHERRYRDDRRLTGRYHLRDGPDQESSSITILNSDQIVTVVKTDGDWAYVNVIPYANEVVITGWIHRSGLAPLGGG